MIELIDSTHNRAIWINPYHIASIEQEYDHEGNKDEPSCITMTNGEKHNIRQSPQYIMGAIAHAQASGVNFPN